MKKVYKYPVRMTDEFTVKMPAGAKILSVQIQMQELQMWALVDPANDVVERRFRVAGTGYPIHGEWDYVGTFQINGGMLVFHLFVEP